MVSSVLVLLDQVVEQVGIATSKSTSDLGVFVHRRTHEIAGRRVHAIDTYAGMPKKDASLRMRVSSLLPISLMRLKNRGRTGCASKQSLSTSN